MAIPPTGAGWLKLRGRDIEDLAQRADRHLDRNLSPRARPSTAFPTAFQLERGTDS
jgi:hypothetical protein